LGRIYASNRKKITAKNKLAGLYEAYGARRLYAFAPLSA